MCGSREGENSNVHLCYAQMFREMVNVHATSQRDRGNMVMCTKTTDMKEQWGK